MDFPISICCVTGHPPQQHRIFCTYHDCSNTFGRYTDLARHFKKHFPVTRIPESTTVPSVQPDKVMSCICFRAAREHGCSIPGDVSVPQRARADYFIMDG